MCHVSLALFFMSSSSALWVRCHLKRFSLPLSSSSCSCFLLYCQLKLSKSATFFLFQLMLFSSHLTVMFFAYPPSSSLPNIRRRLFVCFLHFECGFCRCCDIWPRQNIKETSLKENCPGRNNITPICCTSFQVPVYFSREFLTKLTKKAKQSF